MTEPKPPDKKVQPPTAPVEPERQKVAPPPEPVTPQRKRRRWAIFRRKDREA